MYFNKTEANQGRGADGGRDSGAGSWLFAGSKMDQQQGTNQQGGGGREDFTLDSFDSKMMMPPEKRARMTAPAPGGGGGVGASSGSQGLMPPPASGARPGKVVSCRNLPDPAVEADLLDACGQFGAISYIQITGRGNALLEFEAIRSAEECVNYNQTTDLFVLQTAVYFQFAPMDEIPRRGLESSIPSSVVVVHVANARYPITVDVVTAICKPIAAVQRILITRRAGITIMIEFTDSDTARNIKHRLNGCDIYSGCCTLKIEFSKLKRLNVVRNDQDQWDYTGAPG